MKSNEFIREIKKKGWTLIRQGKGSHEIYEKTGSKYQFPIMDQKSLAKDWNKN